MLVLQRAVKKKNYEVLSTVLLYDGIILNLRTKCECAKNANAITLRRISFNAKMIKRFIKKYAGNFIVCT